MTATTLGRHDQGGAAVRWVACFALVVALHGAALLMMLRYADFQDAGPAAQEAVLLDLTPEPTAPEPVKPPLPTPEPEPVKEQAAPPPPTPEPPMPDPEPAQTEVPPAREIAKPAVVLPAPPPPPPPKRPVRRPVAKPAPRPPEQKPDSPPEQTAALAPVAPAAPAAAPSNAAPTWRSELIGRLQRAKRYPDVARARGEQGVSYATFTMSRNGEVLAARLVRPSGWTALDEEAVALIHRAEPLPPLPAEISGNTITLTVPITFSLR